MEVINFNGGFEASKFKSTHKMNMKNGYLPITHLIMKYITYTN